MKTPEKKFQRELPYRVVDAWAMMFPPIGFLSFPPYIAAAASGDDITWFVTTTAIPNCGSDNKRTFRALLQLSILSNLPRLRVVTTSEGTCQGVPDALIVLLVR